MPDAVLEVIFSWPFVAFSVLLAVVGILNESSLLVVFGAITKI